MNQKKLNKSILKRKACKIQSKKEAMRCQIRQRIMKNVKQLIKTPNKENLPLLQSKIAICKKKRYLSSARANKIISRIYKKVSN